MIAVLGIILGRGHAGCRAAIHQILAPLEIKHRQAVLGEAEMVGAIIIALFRRRLQRGDAALRRQGAVEIGVELRLALADHHHIPGEPGDAERVHVDAANGLGEGKNGVLAIIGRTQQARFLRRHRQEHLAAVGRPGLHIGLCQRDQRGGAGGVVDRAVADVVPVGRRLAAAQMIPMRAVEHIFVRAGLARQQRNDIFRAMLAQVIVEGDVRLHAGQRHGLEAGLLGGPHLRVKVHARAGEQRLRLVLLDPADRGGLVGIAIGAVGDMLRAGPARLHDIPAIGGGHRVMDDDRGGCALARGFLIFVGPAAIIGHRAAVEGAGQAGRLVIGIIHQDDDGLPLHIHAGIVVPALFRGVDAIAHEDDRAVLDRNMRLGRAIGADHHFGAIGGGDGGFAAGEGQRRDILRGDLDQRDILEPAAIIAGLQAQLREFGREQRQRLLLARRSGRAPFIGVGRQFLHQPLHRVDRWACGGGCRLRGGAGGRSVGHGRAGRQGQEDGDRQNGAAHDEIPFSYRCRGDATGQRQGQGRRTP